MSEGVENINYIVACSTYKNKTYMLCVINIPIKVRVLIAKKA